MDTHSHIETNYTVFLAEDDLDDQEMLMDMMREQHPSIRFLTATTGSKTLETLRNIPHNDLPCLIVLDYNLPEMSGAEILEKIKGIEKFDKSIKVVWSTSNSPVYQKKCMDLGAHSYIVKPTGIEGVRTIAKQLVAMCIK